MDRVTVTRPRAAIPTQLREFFAAAGIAFQDGYMGGGQVFIVNGTAYTPGGAANRHLPGGFDGAYGQPGKLPRYRVGEQVHDALTVVDVLGAATYADGFLALCVHANGRAFVIPA